MTLPKIVTHLPEVLALARVVTDVVQEVKGKAAQAASGGDVEPAVQAVTRADDVLEDVVSNARVLVVREVSNRNRLQFALERTRTEEKESRDAAGALDRRRPGDPAAVAHMARSLAAKREADRLAAELAEAEAHVQGIQDFLATAQAHQEDVRFTTAMLRRRYERAERVNATTGLAEQLQQRLSGVRELTARVDDFRADADAAWQTRQLDPEQARLTSYGRLRNDEAEDALRELRGGGRA